MRIQSKAVLVKENEIETRYHSITAAAKAIGMPAGSKWMIAKLGKWKHYSFILVDK